ncbi:MAG: lipoprotein-releasing ABC transporter permease subunit [Stappiaceae bacterium]
MSETTMQADNGGKRDNRPFAPFEWMLAGRYLRSRRREAFISVIAGFSFFGIMLGVATLIVVMAVMNGFRDELLSKILGISGHMTVQPIDSPLDDYDAVAARLENVDQVRFVMPYIEGQALASGPVGASGVLVKGLMQADLNRLPLVSENLVIGSLENFDSGEGVAIGSRLARSLGVAIGDNVTIVTPKGNVTVMGVTPRVVSYPINAIFEIGMAEYDSTFIFMPFEQAQLYFNREGLANGIDIFVDDPDNMDGLRLVIEEAAVRPTTVFDWRQRNLTFFSALEVERNVMFIILTLIVIVAALNIISGLTMLVKDKSHDIAILRTMGASRSAVMRIFVITGSSIGIVGTMAGVILGTIICLNVESIRQFISWMTRTELFSPELYFLSRLPAKMETGETISVVVMTLVLSFLASLYPAWKAARLDPVEALRYE